MVEQQAHAEPIVGQYRGPRTGEPAAERDMRLAHPIEMVAKGFVAGKIADHDDAIKEIVLKQAQLPCDIAGIRFRLRDQQLYTPFLRDGLQTAGQMRLVMPDRLPTIAPKTPVR